MSLGLGHGRRTAVTLKGSSWMRTPNAIECHLSYESDFASGRPGVPGRRRSWNRRSWRATADEDGTIASPWRYDCVIDCAIRPAALRRDYNLHHSLVRTGYESATDAGSSALSTMALKDNSFSL